MDSFTYRDKVGMALTNRLVDSIENGQITQEEGAMIASYLQDRLNQIADDGELALLLTEMAEKWNIFEQLFIPTGDPAPQEAQQPAAAPMQEAEQHEKDQEEMKKVEEALSQIQTQGGAQ